MNSLNKYILFLLPVFICLSGFLAFAQSPAQETTVVMDQVRAPEFFELKPEAYNSLETIWKRATEDNPSDANAWLNYYKAARFSNYSEHSKELNKEEKQKLDAILNSMASAVPSTFAYYYAAYLNGEKTDESFSYLKAAYNLDSTNPELFDDMLCNAMIHGPAADVRSFSEKLSGTGAYNAAEIEYNRNVFNSVEQSSILITNGNVDTYPLIIMQQLQGYRTDVMIICLDWLKSNKYREMVAKQLLITPKGLDAGKILNSGKSKPVYVSLTVAPSILKKYSNELYCTGLAMKHSFSPLRNMESLAYNWEFLFAKTKMNTSDQINRNYLLPLIQLRTYYNNQSRGGEAAKADQQIRDLSQRFGLDNAIKKHLD